MEFSKDEYENQLKNLSAKTANIERMIEKGNDVVILQYGSYDIKYGFGNENQPRTFRNLLSYRYVDGPKFEGINTPPTGEQLAAVGEEADRLEDFLMEKGNINGQGIKAAPQPNKIKLKKTDAITDDVFFISDIWEANNDLKMKEEPLDNGSSSNPAEPQIFFGHESLSALDRPDFVLRQPIKYGLLNISEGYPEEEIINDLEKITEHVVYELLGIPGNDLKNYSVIICAPDRFHRGQYKSIISMLMRKIGFGSFFIHLDSVLATFGACQSVACVVDIGHTHITISCVDEGLVV
jgi:actin-related protein